MEVHEKLQRRKRLTLREEALIAWTKLEAGRKWVEVLLKFSV